MDDATLCPVARSTELIGDRWSMLVVRELFAGSARFDEMRTQTGATPQMLATRLKRLEAEGIVDRRVYSRHPLRHEYVLSRKGRELYPVLLAFRAWGERWCKGTGEPLAIRTTHRTCGAEVGLDGRCPTCNVVVSAFELDASPSPEYAAERQRRATA